MLVLLLRLREARQLSDVLGPAAEVPACEDGGGGGEGDTDEATALAAALDLADFARSAQVCSESVDIWPWLEKELKTL